MGCQVTLDSETSNGCQKNITNGPVVRALGEREGAL